VGARNPSGSATRRRGHKEKAIAKIMVDSKAVQYEEKKKKREIENGSEIPVVQLFMSPEMKKERT